MTINMIGLNSSIDKPKVQATLDPDFRPPSLVHRIRKNMVKQ